MGRPVEYSIWTDVVGAVAPGTRVVSLRDVVAVPGPEDFHHIKRNEYTASIEIARGSSDWTHVADERVVRYQNSSTASDFDEWRIRDFYEGVNEAGHVVGRVECVAPIFDLDRSGIIEWEADDGTVLTHFPVGTRTPTAILNIGLGLTAQYISAAPAHFKVGTIDPTDEVDFVFQDDTAWTMVLELAKLTGSEFWWDRDPADDQYRIHLLNRIGGTHEEVRFEVSRNIFAFEHRGSTQDSLTRVTPVGSTSVIGERVGIGNNAWQIASVSPIVMVDDLVLEDDQLNLMGVYASKPDGLLTAVTDCASPASITLADETGLAAGDVLRFRRGSGGGDMTWLDRPSEAAKIPNPPIAATLPRPDIPPIDNELTNGYLKNGWGALPTGFVQVGSATITQNTNEAHSNFGGISARVVAPNIGDGIAAVTIAVSPTTRRPYFTPQSWLEVISGKVEMLLYDVTNDVWYPDATSAERAVTDWIGWGGMAIAHGINHVAGSGDVTLTTLQFEIHWVAATPQTEFYLDAGMLTNTHSGERFDAFIDGRASNLLWLAGNDELAVRPIGLSTYQAKVADLNRLDAVKWPDQSIEMGGDARIVARLSSDTTQAPFEATTRILGRRRFREDETRTEIEFETERERLTRQLTERKQRSVQPQTLDHLKPPRCGLNLTASLIGPDLIVEWDLTNWERIRLKDVTGLTGTPQQRFDAGVELFAGDATDWTLLDGQTTAQGATPGQIKTVMIEAYNRWGKPGKCLEDAATAVVLGLFKCSFPNLLPDLAAGQTHCTADCVPTCTPSVPAIGTPPIVLHTFAPLIAAASPSITPGVTTLSLCHEGSTSGSGTLSGFGTYGIQVVASQTHNMYGTLGESTAQQWDRDTTPFNAFTQQRAMYGVYVGPESGQIRQRLFSAALTGGLSRWDATRTTVHDPFGLGTGYAFRPGVVVAQESIGSDTGECYVYWSAACAGVSIAAHNIMVRGLSSEKIRLTRNAGDPRLGATTIVSGVQTGDYEWPLDTVNNAAGYWDVLEVLDASDVVQATFLGSEMPSGKIWPGSVFDFGGPFTIGPLCLAINAAADLCLEEDGFIYEEDWAAVSSIDASKYDAVNFTLDTGAGRLVGSATSTIVRKDVGTFPDIVVMAVTGLLNDTSAAHGPAAVMGSVNDVQSTLRATFDDGTIVTGTGVSTGDLATFAPEQVLQDFVWPAAATQLIVEQLHIGTDAGEACSRQVMLNVGPQCCAYVDPSNVTVGLPSTDPGCILNSAIASLLGVDTCAGGLGVHWFHHIFWNTTQACVNITPANGYYFEVLWFEENDPVNEPGILRHAATFTDPFPIPTGWNVGDPPVHILYGQRIIDEDVSQVAPSPGSIRGSNGIDPQPKAWEAVVLLKNQFLPHNTYGSSTSNRIDTPEAYDWCS